MKPAMLPFVLMCMIVNSCSLQYTPAGSRGYYAFVLPQEVPQHYEPGRNLTTVSGAELGKLLFNDGRLSSNGKVSCGTCHRQDYAFTDRLPLSIGISGSSLPRNAMPLFNLAWTERFFWDGRAASLEEAVAFPIAAHDEMNCDTVALVRRLSGDKHIRQLVAESFGEGPVTFSHIRMGLAQYLRTITSFDAPIDRMYPLIREASGKGMSQQEILKQMLGLSDNTVKALKLCQECHSSVTYGNQVLRNNGLVADTAASVFQPYLFKVPSLRNVALTAPYMHDGRFSTLEEVIDYYDSGILKSDALDPLLQDASGAPLRLMLTKEEKAELLYFLNDLLTDSTFIKSQGT